MTLKTLNAPLNTDTLNIMKRSLPTTTIDKYMKVIDLRKAGLTFEEIAERVGYESRSGAKMAFDSAVKYWGHESVTECIIRMCREGMDISWSLVLGPDNSTCMQIQHRNST